MFSCYSHFKPMVDNDASWAGPIWTQSKGMVGRIYKGDY